MCNEEQLCNELLSITIFLHYNLHSIKTNLIEVTAFVATYFLTRVHQSSISPPLCPCVLTEVTWFDLAIPTGWWHPAQTQHWWCRISSWPGEAPRCHHTASLAGWISLWPALGPGCETPEPSLLWSGRSAPSGWLEKWECNIQTVNNSIWHGKLFNRL